MTVQAPTLEPETVTEPDAPAPAGVWSARIFWIAVAAAVPVILWFGRDHWFFLDEWQVLTQGGPTDGGYLVAHNGHWITIVRLDYRLNYWLWGLRSYLPYQLPVVLAHVGAAVLLRQIVLRLGVRGWIATSTVLAFLYFGSGRTNFTFGFQISLTGSVLCGLALFLVAAGPRRVTRRDWLGLGLGVVGLMTSSVFPPILVGFGVTTLVRRGLRVTAFYTLPLGAIYLAWYARYATGKTKPLELTGGSVRFAGRMLWAVFDALAQSPIGVILAAVAVVGLAAAVQSARRSGDRSRTALLLGIVVAWLTFTALTSLARAGGVPGLAKADAERYLHVGAALALPAIAAGAEALAKRCVALGALALVPLALGLPGNLDQLAHTSPYRRGDHRHQLFAIAHSPFVDDVPPDTPALPSRMFALPLTTGWLSQQAAAGRIPEPDLAEDPTADLTATNTIALAQEPGTDDGPACPRLTTPVRRTLQPGESLRFTGPIDVTVTDGERESQPRTFLARKGSVIRAVTGPVDVRVRQAEGNPATLCAPTARPADPPGG